LDDIDALVDEAITIQNRLLYSCSSRTRENNACVFARLMLQGKVKQRFGCLQIILIALSFLHRHLLVTLLS